VRINIFFRDNKQDIIESIKPLLKESDIHCLNHEKGLDYLDSSLIDNPAIIDRRALRMELYFG